jgi:hypothetical protein
MALRDDASPYWESNLGRPARSPSLYRMSCQSSKKPVKVCKNLLHCHVSMITNVMFERQSSLSLKITILLFVTSFSSQRPDFFRRNILPLFSWSRSKSRKKQSEAAFSLLLLVSCLVYSCTMKLTGKVSLYLTN